MAEHTDEIKSLDHYSQDDLRDLIKNVNGGNKNIRAPKKIRVITDTSDFFKVDYNDVVILDRVPYFIRHYEKEGRFGIDDEPKFWVKRAINLLTGKLKIIKMVFPERFQTNIADVTFECIRSPRKEGRILGLVKGHPNFMQGFGVKDSAGNIIRILDYIKGEKLSHHIFELDKNHEDYYYNQFPSVLEEYIELVEAIRFIHEKGEQHGDIRRDHLIKDRDTGKYRWIDFDFYYTHRDNKFGYDLFGLGNILSLITGRGDVILQDLKNTNPSVYSRLTLDDLNIIFSNRIVNLKKVFPYISDTLNFMLLHFSMGASIFYGNTTQFLTDLKGVKSTIG